MKNCFWLVVAQKSWLQKDNPIPEHSAPSNCHFLFCFGFSEIVSWNSLMSSLDALLNNYSLLCASMYGHYCFITFEHLVHSFTEWAHHWNHNSDWNFKRLKKFWWSWIDFLIQKFQKKRKVVCIAEEINIKLIKYIMF